MNANKENKLLIIAGIMIAGILVCGLLAIFFVLFGGVSVSNAPVYTDLDNSEWVLDSLNGRSLIPSSRITLEFSGDDVTGYSGCNGYGGPYTATAAGSLTITQIDTTVQDCPEEGVMAQESAFREALATATSYQYQNDHLEINNAAGETILTFERLKPLDMNPADLVGTAWQLTAWEG